jgi:hypothetical protein
MILSSLPGWQAKGHSNRGRSPRNAMTLGSSRPVRALQSVFIRLSTGALAKADAHPWLKSGNKYPIFNPALGCANLGKAMQAAPPGRGRGMANQLKSTRSHKKANQMQTEANQKMLCEPHFPLTCRRTQSEYLQGAGHAAALEESKCT